MPAGRPAALDIVAGVGRRPGPGGAWHGGNRSHESQRDKQRVPARPLRRARNAGARDRSARERAGAGRGGGGEAVGERDQEGEEEGRPQDHQGRRQAAHDELRRPASRRRSRGRRSRSRAASSCEPGSDSRASSAPGAPAAQLPGLVPFRCAGKAKLKPNGRKIKRLDPCENNLEPQAPLLENPRPIPFGYFEDWILRPGRYDELAAGGATIARADLSWRTLQPNAGAPPTAWNWAPSDDIYNSMVAVGVRPVFTFIDAPCWAAVGLMRRLGQPAGRGPPRRLRSRRGADRAALPAGRRDRDLARAQQRALLGRQARAGALLAPRRRDDRRRPRDGQPDPADHRRAGARARRPRPSSSTASSSPRRWSAAGSRPLTRSASTL